MASHTPGGQTQKSRHRITNIRLEPSTSNYDIRVKILVDGQEAHRLASIQRGTSLTWENALSCDVNPDSHVEIRVYEKHFLVVKRVGALKYVVSTISGQSETSLELDTKQFIAVLSFSTPEAAPEAVDIVHETVDAVDKVLSTHAQQALLKELRPVGSARYDSTRACLPGTRTNIINKIVDWSQRQDTSEGMLWVYGQAGLGKSSIAVSVCQELDNRRLLAGHFFCKRDSSESRNPQHVLTTIVYQLALEHSGYAICVADAIRVDDMLCSSPLQIQYDNLVKKPLEMSAQPPLSANLVVVVDALDECGTYESRRQLLAYLHRMSQLVPWLRIIITSRPDPDIQSFFDDQATFGVSRENVYEYNASNDIRQFIHHRMKDSLKSRHLPPDAADLLSERADGLFIWAKTACELILNSHDPKSRFDLVVGKTGMGHLSSPLDALYTTTIETSLGDGGAEDAQVVQQCLGAIIVCSTRTPLSVGSLSGLLGDQVNRSVLQYVVDSLGSVLYTDDAQGGLVRVYHPSFADYMIFSAPLKFRVDQERQNTDFARRCLQTMKEGLRFNICGLETSHIRNSEVSDLSTRIDTTISIHLRYSCLYWASHLTQSKEGELEHLLREFLLRPTVLYWVEALSLLGKLDVAMYSALELSGWSEGLDDIYQCARDTYRFVMAFYDPISTSTPHLYVSAVAFCPNSTAFSQRLRATFRNTLAITRGAEEGWSPWLRCISHPAKVFAIAISKDGRRIVSGLSDLTVRVWDADTGAALGSPLVGHSDTVRSVGFSPDGRHIVSGSSDMAVRVWDADTGAALVTLVGHSDTVLSVGFSPNGRRIVSGSSDMTVRVWDVDTGVLLGSPMVGHSDTVRSAGFSPDGRRIVSGSSDMMVRVWDADTGTALGSPLVGHSDTVRSVGFSPDSRRIVSGSSDMTVRVWDADTGVLLGSPMVGHSDTVLSAEFSPDGRRIVSGSLDTTVRVWDADTGAALGSPLVGHSGWVYSVGFSPDGRRIISGSSDNTVRVWDTDTDSPLGNPLVGHSGWVYSVGFSPDGRQIVSGSSDMTVRMWDADTGSPCGNPLVGHSGWVYSVGLSPDGRRIVSGSYDMTVRVWDANTGSPCGNPLVGHSGWVYSVGFSPDSRRIVSGSSDMTVRVWDADTGVLLGSPLVGHSDTILSVGFSPDGRHIVSGSYDMTVRVWAADTGTALGSPLVGHSGWVYSVGFSPDGRRIVSGSSDMTVRVWDPDTSAALGSPLVGHSDSVLSVGFSSDGRHIVSGSSDMTVRVWDADTGTVLGSPLVGHSGWVYSVGFSPDGRHIVSGSDDNTVRVWDIDTSAALGSSLAGHSDTIRSVGFSSLPHNTSHMSDSLSSDGWVCDKTTNALLVWLPEGYRRTVVDDSLFVISNNPVLRPVLVESSRFVHGPHWESIYTP